MFAAVIENEKTSSEFEDPKGSPVVKETEVVEPVAVANGEGCELKTQQEQDDNNSEGSQTIFSYERLKVKSGNPVTGIDFKRREVCGLNCIQYSFLMVIFHCCF